MKNITGKIFQNIFRKEGQSYVEVILAVPLLMVLLYGIAEFGKILHAYLTLENASRQGAITASQLNINPPNTSAAAPTEVSSDVITFINTSNSTYPSQIDTSSGSFGVNWRGFDDPSNPPGSNIIRYVEVSVVYSYPLQFFARINTELNNLFPGTTTILPTLINFNVETTMPLL